MLRVHPVRKGRGSHNRALLRPDLLTHILDMVVCSYWLSTRTARTRQYIPQRMLATPLGIWMAEPSIHSRSSAQDRRLCITVDGASHKDLEDIGGEAEGEAEAEAVPPSSRTLPDLHYPSLHLHIRNGNRLIAFRLSACRAH